MSTGKFVELVSSNGLNLPRNAKGVKSIREIIIRAGQENGSIFAFFATQNKQNIEKFAVLNFEIF